MEDVARHHAREQDDDLGRNEQGGSGFHGGPRCGFQGHQPLRRPCPRCEDSLWIGEFGMGVHVLCLLVRIAIILVGESECFHHRARETSSSGGILCLAWTAIGSPLSQRDTSCVSTVRTRAPRASPAACATAFTWDSTPFSHMSMESPMRPLVCATVAAATPRFCSMSNAAMPALSLPTPASLKITALSGTSSANSPELVPPCD